MMQYRVEEPRSDVDRPIATFVTVSVPRKHIRRNAREKVKTLEWIVSSIRCQTELADLRPHYERMR
jgi:hypothetical protein